MANNTTCSLWHHHPNRCDILMAVQHVFPGISMVGCCFIMVVIILFKKYHVFVQRLIFGLAFSAMLQSASYLFGNVHSKRYHSVCHVQGFMMQFFSWSTLSWVIVITVNMVLIVKGIDSKRFELHYHAFVWLNALLWACLPFIKDAYGPAGIWCWIMKEHNYLRFGVWYAPLLIVCIFMLITYLYLFIHNRRLARSARGTDLHMLFKTYRKEVKPLLIYPLLYLVLTVPIFVYRLYDATHPNKEPMFGLLLASVIVAPSVGSCNAMAYAFYNKTIREITWYKFKQAFFLSMKGKDCNIRPYTVDSLRGNASKRSTIQRATIKSENLEFHNKWFEHKQDCNDDSKLNSIKVETKKKSDTSSLEINGSAGTLSVQ